MRVQRQTLNHDRRSIDRSAERVFGFEHSFLVFLEVLAVPDWQALHGRQPAGEASDDAAGLPTNELQWIGILLLRHQAAAGGGRVRKIEEAELFRREEDEI